LKFTKSQIIFFGFAVHVLAAFYSVGYHQCDELFQVYEFAGFKLGLNSSSELPWEFHERMRSGIQPFIVYWITNFFHSVSVTNPFSIASFIRICMALLSFTAIVKFLNLLEREIVTEKLKRWLWYSGLLFWCIPYFHARFSSENFSATLLMLGFVMLLNTMRHKNSYGLFLVAGILLGLAFVSRFQISFMITGLLAWLLLVNKTRFQYIAVIFFGIFIALFVGMLCDQWLYNEWTISWWNYLDLNLFQDKASVYGKEPVYFYLEQVFLQLLPPFSVAIVFCVVAFWIKLHKHVVTWMTVPFILLHFFVAHKELRFLFPALNFLPFMLIMSLQQLQNKSHPAILYFKKEGFLRFAVVVNMVALLYFSISPADNTSYSLKKIYDLVEGKSPVLYYEGANPYNNNASLHYFRNDQIRTIQLTADGLHSYQKEQYYFSEKFNEGETIIKNNKKFVRIYSSLPDWISYLNFNGWLNRAVTFSIYKHAL